MTSVTRRRFLESAALVTGALLRPGDSPLAAAASGEASRPNILFLLADDLRADAIHALGDSPVRTPNIDRLAQDGTVFHRAYIMGSTQPAVCMPSRGMLLTGRNLFHLPKDFAGNLDTPCVSMPEQFRNAGYTTFVTGKWHNDREALARGFDRGDSIFFGGMSDHFKIRLFPFDATGRFPIKTAYTGDRHSSEIFADSTVRFLTEYDGNRPFFAYVPFTAPHDPRQAPPQYKDLYKPDEIPLPPNFLPQHPFDNGELNIRDELLAPHPRTPGDIRRHAADYYAIVTHLDAQIGRILEALRATGRDKNTLIVFAADNGLALGSHGLLGKQNVYEHSIRVPLILCGPGVTAGANVHTLCYLHDLFPTLCELAGTNIPESVEARSLAPILRQETGTARTSIMHAYRDVQRAVSTERWKLIRYQVNGAAAIQLFDLLTDPFERRNLVEDHLPEDRIKALDVLLQQHMREMDDPAAGLYPALV